MRSIESELNDHASFLRALARRLVVDDAAADDLVQDTFALALDRPPSRAAGALPWLVTALRRRASTGRKAASRRARREREAAQPEATGDVSEMAAAIELGRRLLAHVEELAEPFRVALFLRYYEGLAPREIAARTGAPVATVKSRLARGLTELREKLDARGDGGRERWMPAAAALGRVDVHAAPTGMTLALQITLATAAAAAAFVGIRALIPAEAPDMVTATGSPELAFGTGSSPASLIELEQPVPPASRSVITTSGKSARDTVVVHGTVVDVSPSERTGAADVLVFPQAQSRLDRPSIDALRSGRVAAPGLGYGAGTNEEAKPIARTDETGHFTVELERTSGGKISLFASETATHRAAAAVVTVAASEHGPIEVLLTRYPHGSLEGVVVDVTGVPIKGAVVTRIDDAGAQVEHVETAIDGRFAFSHVRRERTARRLTVTAPGRLDVTRTRTHALVHGGWNPITITLAERGVLEVSVLDADGGVRADCDVFVTLGKGEISRRTAMGPASGPLTATTDESGLAVFDAVPAGLGLMLVAHQRVRGAVYDRARDGVALAMNSERFEDAGGRPIVALAGQRVALSVVLPTDRVLSVAVVDPSGQPVPNAVVDLRSDGTVDSRLEMIAAIPATDSTGRTDIHLAGIGAFESLYLSTWHTADEGRQQFAAVTQVNASDPPGRRYTLTLRESAPIEGTVIVPSDRVNWTSIKAVPAGDPAAADTPQLTPWHGSLGVDARGQIQGRLPHGRYSLTAEHPLHGSITQTVDVPAKGPVEFVFTDEPDATVWIEIETGGLDVASVQVLVGSYRPLRAASAALLPTLKSGPVALTSGRPTDAVTRVIGWQQHDAGGVHTLRNSVTREWQSPIPVPVRSGPGWIGVQLNDSNMRPYAVIYTDIVNIPAGETRLTFEAAPTVDVRCRLVDPDGAALRGAGLCVGVRDAHGQRFSLTRGFKEGALRGWRTTGYQGFFTIESLPLGSYTLEVGTSAELEAGAPFLVMPFTVEADTRETLAFEVPAR